ncbi:MAG TPA: 4Fe-4S binding protein [bacterium]|nr:4Fe-4S binding protein [bacterium]
MCEFCHKHGEGKKWYLQAKNYSDDLLSDQRRRKFIQDFVVPSDLTGGDFARMERLDKLPDFVRRVISWNVSRKMKKVHYGQVLPIEDIEQVFGFVNSIVRVSCICRKATVGNEQRYCYGISMVPDGGGFGKILRETEHSFYTAPDTGGMEARTREEAIAEFRAYEKEGLCHTVWTFVAPFIAGVCNCDSSDCLAMKSTLGYGVPIMFRAEYVAEANPDLCSGCRSCMRVCQFGAIGYSAAREKASIDPRRCYGCGICRSVCSKDAISLRDRASVAAAASLW